MILAVISKPPLRANSILDLEKSDIVALLHTDILFHCGDGFFFLVVTQDAAYFYVIRW